ncbi:MAG: hypothetical protein NTZ67_09860 [Gammaproteobacteria bacterium]|nr:hypothetical protein [Gammaproteobacteria bacterium]
MRQNVLFGLCAFVFSIFTINAFAIENLFAPASVNVKACAPVSQDDTSGFCGLFTPAVICQCDAMAGSLAPIECDTVSHIYSSMLSMYGLQGGCTMAYEQGWATSVKACIEQWNCYNNGGKDADGNLCSGTGKACA